MAKHTTRDKVWSAVMNQAEENAGKGGWAAKLNWRDIEGRMENPPTEKTIRETMATMAELGHIEDTYGRGDYKPSNDTVAIKSVKVSELNSLKSRILDDESREKIEERIQKLESELEEAKASGDDSE